MPKKSLDKILNGYRQFRGEYAGLVAQQNLAKGQQPEAMIIACCDSRVDPALLLQCDPGELFVHRNVANIVPPFEKDESHHGTSAALEYGVCYLHVKHLILIGHSQCGGVNAMLNKDQLTQNDFISNWVQLIQQDGEHSIDDSAKQALLISQKNLMTFPWIKSRVEQGELMVHLWFFDIHDAAISAYSAKHERFELL